MEETQPCPNTTSWRQVTEVGVVPGQPVEGGVERPDEEEVPQLHYGHPHEVPQEQPGQNAALETHR